MNALLNLLASEAWTQFTFTLLHTLWQAPLAAVALYAVLRAVPVERPDRRYAAALAALGLVLLAAMFTWSVYRLDGPPMPPETPTAVSTPVDAVAIPVVVHGSYRAAAPVQSAHWTAWLAVAWLAGTGLGLLRTGRLLLRAGRVRRQAEAWEDPAVREALERLATALGMARRVRVAVSARIDVPGVVGLLRPVVVFPAAIASGMPPAHLDAILAHELAHIRRCDYWVNLLQLLVEALLFFNPAVWWISRRIRVEREACCDALAASATGLPVDYATALAALAERLSTEGVQPALAVAGGEEHHVLLDRVKRLVVPGYRPRLGLSWYALTALLFGGMAILAGLSQGVFSAVALAAHTMTPTERMEQIQALQEVNGTPEPGSPSNKVPISGIVRTDDSAPLPEDFSQNLRIVSLQRCGAVSSTRFFPDGRFEDAIAPGTVYVVADASGYAFTVLGPLTAKPGGNLNGLELVLRRGAPARIHVTGRDGLPVAGAKLSGYYQVKSGGVGKATLETNPDGLAAIDHYAGTPFSFETVADGYARERFEGIVLDPRRPFECTLKPARPSSGVATAEESGAPLAGLVLRLYGEHEGRSTRIYMLQGEELAVTDAQGRFAINTLRDDTVYALLAQGADGRKCIVSNVGPGQTLDFSVPPPIRVRGRITGDLSLLARDEQGPFVACDQTMKTMTYGSETIPGKARVELREKEGFFETEPLLPGEVNLSAGPRQLRLKVPRPSDELVIDLAPGKQASSDTRTLVLRLQPEPGLPLPEGAVDLEISQPGFQPLDKNDVPLVNGEARVDIPVPSTVEYRFKGLVGYWAEEERDVAVSEGSEPFALTVPVKPAGAVHGRVLNANGSNAATGTGISLVRIKVPRALKGKAYFQHGVVRDGTFLLSSVPFGLTCSVLAWDEHRMVESEDFRIDERNPIHEVSLQFVPGESIRGRLVDEKGDPMAGLSVGLRYGRRHSDSYGGTDTARSGPDGRFAIENVNPDMPGQYSLELDSRINFVPFNVPVAPGEKEYLIAVKRGVSLEGRVVDEKTGAPLVAAVVTAIGTKTRDGVQYFPSESHTDPNGAFRFSNLLPGKYYFYVNGVVPNMESPVAVGTGIPIVLKMTP